MANDKLPNDIVAQVSKEFNVSHMFVRELYDKYWKAVREFIESRDLTVSGKFDDYTDVIVPKLGTFIVSEKKQLFKNKDNDDGIKS